MEIDINQYLSEEDKRRIAEEEYRNAMRSWVVVDKERILSNAAYTVVQKLVDEQFGEDMNKILVDKTVEIIKNLSSHSVFKRKDAWDKDESKGYKYLQEAVDNNKDLIEAKVAEIIESLDASQFHYKLEELMYQVVENRLLGKTFKQDEEF